MEQAWVCLLPGQSLHQGRQGCPSSAIDTGDTGEAASRVATEEDWRAANQKTPELETAGVAEKLFSCHSGFTRKPAWSGVWGAGQEGEREVRRLWGRKASPGLPLTGKSLRAQL